jgi:hypothetical protein
MSAAAKIGAIGHERPRDAGTSDVLGGTYFMR